MMDVNVSDLLQQLNAELATVADSARRSLVNISNGRRGAEVHGNDKDRGKGSVDSHFVTSPSVSPVCGRTSLLSRRER